MRKHVIAGCLLALLAPKSASAGTIFFDDAQRLSLSWGADAYYSFLGLSASVMPPMVGENVLDAKEEDQVYGYLLSHIYIPRYLNLELSANPLPILGVYLKSEQPGIYGAGAVYQSINLIESITAGFPEPGALSLFIGNNVFFVNFENNETVGMGFGGFLVSYGNYHIVNNLLVSENWWELEGKLKGVSISELRKLSFSFRVGARFHAHPEIDDTVYLSFVRDHLDKGTSAWSLFQNTSFEVRADFSTQDLKPSRFVALLGKKFPISEGAVVFHLAAGVSGVFRGGYSGTLQQTALVDGLSLLIRPNLTF